MSKVCREEARCTAKEGKCVVGGIIDCMHSALCKKQGRCRFADGECIDPKAAKP